jgi:hypothetical protein
MSCAYVIEADHYPDDEGDLTTLVDGKLLTRRIDFINRIAEQLSLPPLDSFYSCSDEFLNGLGFDPIEVADSEQWFDVADGLRWFVAVRNHVLAHQDSIDGAAELIEELTDFLQALRDIAARGGCWRLTLDF